MFHDKVDKNKERLVFYCPERIGSWKAWVAME